MPAERDDVSGPRTATNDSKITHGGRLHLRDLVSLPSVWIFALSWQRDRLAFYWDKTGRIELYIMSLSDRNPRQVSHGEVPRAMRTGFVWDRAGATLVFGRDKDGNEQHDLYQIDATSGAVTQLTSDPTCEEHPLEFAPGDECLLVGSNRQGKGGRKQMNLWRFDVAGRTYTQLTDFANPVNFWGGYTFWSPRGDRLAFTANESSVPRNSDVYVAEADGASARRVFRGREGSSDSVSSWSPDGRRLAITSDVSGTERPGILDLETGEVRWLGTLGHDEGAGPFSPTGKYVLTLRHAGVSTHLLLYEVSTGRPTELSLGDGLAWPADFLADDRGLVYRYTSPTCPLDLRRYDIESREVELLLSGRKELPENTPFSECDTVRYKTFDGLDIEGLLYRPSSGRPGERYPALVEVHGGPTGQYFRSFDPFAQYLASQGYVILRPNIRGSTGYGTKFRDLALKDWGGADLEDVVYGAKFLQSLEYVDSQRIGIWGGSYGGYMTFMAVVKRPELWKAAVAWVGITELHKMYDKSTEHFRFFLREQMGDPEADSELWRDRSALYFADQMRAKLLMMHGANDPRCPVEQSRLFRDRLEELGRKKGQDYEYVEFTDEGHGSTDISQKIRVTEILADYLKRAL